MDSRKLNSITGAYSIPNIDGLLSRFASIYWILKIDLKDAFWQIKSKPKTAFTVSNRPLYQFTRIPFGLCSALQTLPRLINRDIPYNMKSHAFVNSDDLDI